MESQIVKQAESYITELLSEKLTEDHRYHSLNHTLSTRETSIAIAKRYNLNGNDMEILELAALFHDAGFTKVYNGHEDVSKEIAANFLLKKNYPEEKIQNVKDVIEATKVGFEPKSMLQKIIKDADFNTNDGSYMDKSDALRHEWKVFCSIEMDDEAWLENSLQFWEYHRFYTGEGLAMFGEEKRKTIKKLNKKLEKKADKKDGKNKSESSNADKLRFAINESKSAQMMFKTTLRNQIDLTNIADNKANIMLSINSLLITFGMPLLVANLEKFSALLYPGAVLLLTCILTIVFATLATRPVKMGGHTDLENIKKGNTNLFFFGNFFKMKQDDYHKGLLEVVQNSEILDNTIVNDLYFLGRALGQKYRRLRITYSIFMIGMVLTVLTFAIAFIVFKNTPS
jgi:predicted metal-dependent HD superfamily phosphohydrolase